MKGSSFLIFTFFWIFCLIGSVHAVSVELTQDFDGSQEPEGPHPQNYPTYKTGEKTGKPYDPTTAQKFTFTLNVSGMQAGQYYDIKASLTRSDYSGFAANFGDNAYKDLTFLESDYVQIENNKTKYLLGWKYETDTLLSHTISTEAANPTAPGSIVVRCYDWGGSGSVTVTVKKRGENMPYTATKSIPFDENQNGIADGWETVGALKKTLANGYVGYDPTEDNEQAPDENNKNNGDGWSIYDEYRGLFKTNEDTEATRLNPMEKEIIVTSDAAMKPFDTGTLSAPDKHTFLMVSDEFVNSPWGEVYNGNKVKQNVSEDIGWVNFNSEKPKIPGFKRVWAVT